MKLACFLLRTDKRLLQTGKTDKLIVFCLVQGKSGCVSLEKVRGGGGPGSAAYEADPSPTHYCMIDSKFESAYSTQCY